MIVNLVSDTVVYTKVIMADVKKSVDVRPSTPVEHGAIVGDAGAPAGDTELLGNYFIATACPLQCNSDADDL